VAEFVKKYQARYGRVPDGMGALGYDATRLLVDAIGRAGSTDGKAIAKALAETKDFPGVTGSITIDAERNAQKSAVVLEMKGGKPVYVATVKPPGAADAAPPAAPVAAEGGAVPAPNAPAPTEAAPAKGAPPAGPGKAGKSGAP
jgi:ABC-type branched-subunit amino acid transport system substrate-binding protein